MLRSLVGSEMCIRDRCPGFRVSHWCPILNADLVCQTPEMVPSAVIKHRTLLELPQAHHMAGLAYVAQMQSARGAPDSTPAYAIGMGAILSLSTTVPCLSLIHI
eukprot:TRINITY_DN52666_c0_g1_i2.p2 TRINITY_DN52666_c0_g1~~TRINITY_DN52666_c0_g1_i2.p2  ORF type:complete len:104 (-),score=26.66 TRINITY_DN52666_c0_g1_i2:141-452(-)